MKRIIHFLLVVFVATLRCAAQTSTSPSLPREMVSPAGSSAEKSFWQWDYFTGDWGGVRTKLSDKGIDFNLTYWVDVWGNVHGGIKQEAVYAGLGMLAARIDLEKLAGWHGATFYSRWLWLSGEDPSAELVGNFFAIGNISGFNTFRNYELWLQQDFLDEKISIRAGQLAGDSEFAISDYASVFLNGTFGWPVALTSNIPNGGPAYPSGAPGVRLKVKPLPGLTIMSAGFQGNVFAQNVNAHGFKWDLNYEQGLLWINEVQWHHSFWLPGDVKAGVWLESGPFVNFSNAAATNSGNYGVYFVLDQMLYREATDEATAAHPSKQGLGAFTRLAFQPADRNYISFYADGGLNYLGLIPGRDMDTAAIGVACGELTSGARAQLVDAGGSGPPCEVVIEATYAAQVTRWLVVEPDIQLILNPSGVTKSSDALVLGMRAIINF